MQIALCSADSACDQETNVLHVRRPPGGLGVPLRCPFCRRICLIFPAWRNRGQLGRRKLRGSRVELKALH